MSSLKDAIASLTNPIPTLQDPEDDVNLETFAHIKIPDDDALNETLYSASELRSKTAPLLEDVDPSYAGQKVSRKSLDDEFHNDIDSFTGSTAENTSVEGDNSSLDEDETDDQENDESAETMIENFKKSVLSQQLDDVDEDKKEESNESESSDDEVGTGDDMVNKFSNIDVTSEIEKGAAVKAQQELFNRLCECRIKLQKLLVICNKLPQFDCWKILKQEGGVEITEQFTKGSNSVKLLLNNCLNLQEYLLKQNPETRNLENSTKQQTSPSDEEISSETNDDMDTQQAEEVMKSKKYFKRKMKCDEYGEILAKRHKSLLPYRDSVIQKWDEKTKLSSGRLTQKSFTAFESSAVQQIQQILQDENRLIKRTQLKRSLYRVLGKPEIPDTTLEENSKDGKPISKQDMLLRDYDPEIFDDDDFYRQLLKDVIESKSVGIDPAILRKQMEIQSIRNKIKRKVDTKASKGRKIRYDVHPKLVNYMAPVQTSTISDAARDNLIKCIFGKSFIQT